MLVDVPVGENPAGGTCPVRPQSYPAAERVNGTPQGE
jgi:hypothetical protein